MAEEETDFYQLWSCDGPQRPRMSADLLSWQVGVGHFEVPQRPGPAGLEARTDEIIPGDSVEEPESGDPEAGGEGVRCTQWPSCCCSRPVM